MTNFFFKIILFIFLISYSSSLPLVINTWGFSNATINAWNTLLNNGNGLDAIVNGCSTCEREQCDHTVGFGGSPDEDGVTTLDAMIMNGETMNVGAVAGMKNIKDAISVARFVLENTKHTLLIGKRATKFAVQMGFREESLTTKLSQQMWNNWKVNKCQPNFWRNVEPDPISNCGPYEPISANDINNRFWSDQNRDDYNFGPEIGHDTIGMIVIDKNQHIFAGTSTNGANHKIPGRIGDSAIAGSGCYAIDEIGGAAATGDGDIMMRFLPSLIAVEELRHGILPSLAGENALKRISKYYPNFMGGIVVATKDGNYGAACHGMDEFPYSVFSSENEAVIVEKVKCFK